MKVWDTRTGQPQSREKIRDALKSVRSLFLPCDTVIRPVDSREAQSPRLERTLNVNLGCGSDRWGDVRVDIRHSGSRNVMADLHNLPFRKGSFEEARMFHVLEHCKDPWKAFSEARRTANRVHAKFPYKWDRIPFVLHMLTSLSPLQVKIAFHDCLFHVLTQIKLLDHPIAHRWMIRPFGERRLNVLEFPSVLRYGRKARFFRRLSLPKMKAEWECKI